MSDWIANAEAGSSVRDKLNTLPRPSRGSFINTHWDVDVPADALFMKVYLANAVATIESDKYLSALFSSDGGDTFYTGGSDYKVAEFGTDTGTLPYTTFDQGAAVVADFGGAGPFGGPKYVEIEICPGSASVAAQIHGTSKGLYGSGLMVELHSNQLMATPARITTVRFALAGDGSPHTLSADYTIQCF